MTVLSIVDVLLPMLPVLEHTKRDDSGAEPTSAVANRLYLWPRRTAAQRLEEDRGRFPEAVLRMRCLITLAARGEVRAPLGNRDRAITQQLDDWLDDVVRTIAANRRHELWWDIYLEGLTYDAVRTVDVRGYGMDIAVRLNEPPVLDFGGTAQ